MSIFLYSLLAAFLGEYHSLMAPDACKNAPSRTRSSGEEGFEYHPLMAPDACKNASCRTRSSREVGIRIPSPNGDPRQHAKTRPAGRILAEREGFEPSVATRTTAVFETAPFNHSGTSPVMRAKLYLRFQHCYVILDNTLAKAVFLLISPSTPWLLFLRHALKIPF
jgi:hypothetical protein